MSHFSLTFFVFGLWVIMCLVSLEGFVAKKLQRVQFKPFRTFAVGKVKCDPQLSSPHSFTPCEFEKCAFPSKMHFCKFYHSIGINNFCLSRELSRYPPCWRQQVNFHIKCPLFINALYHLRVPAIVGNCLITVQCMHLTSLCEFMCVFKFLPPLHIFCTADKSAHVHHDLLVCATSDPCQLDLQSCIWRRKALSVPGFRVRKTSSACQQCWPESFYKSGKFLRQVYYWLKNFQILCNTNYPDDMQSVKMNWRVSWRS